MSAKLLHPRCILRPASPQCHEWRNEPLRCAESSTPAGSPIAAINAHSGRGVVRPPRSFLAHRPLGRLFFRFAGPIACSSRQRLRFAQPLARRRMAAQRFCRLLTLSDLISAISAPVLRSVIGSAPAPLRGSWRQQPREALVSAAMIAPCAGDVLRAAVVARKPVFMRFRRGGGLVARVGANLLHIAPTHPAARRCGSLTLPHRRSAPPTKNSAAKKRFRGFGQRGGFGSATARGFGRDGRIWREEFERVFGLS